MTEHPEPEALESFMRNEVDADQRRRIVRHLLAGCARCTEITRGLWALGEERPDAPLGELFDPVDPGGRVREERRRAPELVAELLDRPAAERRELVATAQRFRTPFICELLLDAAREAVAVDPDRGADLADLAVGVAERLDPGLCGATLARSAQDRSWACLANARRLAGDLQRAEEALFHARGRLEEGGGDPLDGADHLVCEALLRADQKRLPEAGELLDAALRIYERAGESHLAGRALAHQGLLRARAGALGEAVDLLRRGLSRLEPGRDPRFALGALQRLAEQLLRAGRAEEAREPLERARCLAEELGDAPTLARLRRLEGKVAEALGHLELAEAALGDALRALVREGMGTEAARVLLEIAALLVCRGRSAELDRLTEQRFPIYRAPGIRKGDVAALIIFRRLVETGTADLPVLSEFARYLAPRAEILPAGPA